MAFFRRPKLPTKKAPTKPWTNEELKVVGWCMNKRIHVSITPDWKHEYNLWQIDKSAASIGLDWYFSRSKILFSQMNSPLYRNRT